MKRITVLMALVLAVEAFGQDSEEDTAAVEPVPAVESHVVEPGDTLWDITARVFGDPFLWPKVWSYNPEITNPNWIYPGDIIRFYPSTEPLPSSPEGLEIASEVEVPEEEERY